MVKVKFAILATALAVSGSATAGGFLTNTNQNIAFNRNFARDGVIAIDGVYSNPAGVAFLPKGFHLSLNIQNVYQTRTIRSGMTVQSPTPGISGWEQTPFYQPLRMNGGDAEGTKTYVGKASAPILPSFQAALNYDKWGFQVGFGLMGGGGKASFNDGLGSFERNIALLPMLLYNGNRSIPAELQANFGLASPTPGYSAKSYMHGQQYVFGIQFGSTYKINENWAVYGGLRFNYAYNRYEGSITDISANIQGKNENLYKYLGNKAQEAQQLSAIYTGKAQEAEAAALLYEQAGNAAAAAQARQLAAQAAGAAAGLTAIGVGMTQYQGMVADKYLDVSQTGWGVTPIIGVDFRYGKLNVGTRLELNTHINMENDIKRDDANVFHGEKNAPSDLPGLWTLGAQYEVAPNVRVMASTHYYFDKSSRMANDRQKDLSRNTMEYLGGVEWDVTKDIMVSAGGQITDYGLGDGKAITDMSFVTSSYSLGFGAKFSVAKNVKVNLAYFWTDYRHFKKNYTQEIQNIQIQNTDDFTRTNKILGVGVDITL